MGIAERYKRTLEEVQEQCVKCGRNPDEVLLLSVSKTVDVCGVRQAASAGAKSFGENRPDQIVEKSEALPELDWHFIGNIQSRRIKDIVRSASLIHSLNHIDHAKKIAKAAEDIGKVQDVLLEVNVSGEATKSGVAPSEAKAFVEEVCTLPSIRLRGLMTMAPQGDLVVAQKCFAGLHGLFDEILDTLPSDVAPYFDVLSAGMSEDWREAISEGSTIVRIGRAIFSDEFVEP